MAAATLVRPGAALPATNDVCVTHAAVPARACCTSVTSAGALVADCTLTVDCASAPAAWPAAESRPRAPAMRGSAL